MHLLVFGFACVLAITAPARCRAQTPLTYPQRWEYRVVPLGAIEGTNQPYNAGRDGTDFTKPFQDGLAKFGNDGWELVGIDLLQGNKVAIFKRPSVVTANR